MDLTPDAYHELLLVAIAERGSRPTPAQLARVDQAVQLHADGLAALTRLIGLMDDPDSTAEARTTALDAHVRSLEEKHRLVHGLLDELQGLASASEPAARQNVNTAGRDAAASLPSGEPPIWERL